MRVVIQRTSGVTLAVIERTLGVRPLVIQGNSKYKLSGDQFSYLTLILILILSQRLDLCYD